MKNIEEIRIDVATSCIQGILEAKGGFLGEIDPNLAVSESFRIADAFVKHYQEHYLSNGWETNTENTTFTRHINTI